MYESTTTRTATPAAIGGDATTIPAHSRDVLTEILRDGAQRLLGQAIEAEVADWIEQHTSLTDDRGRQQVVRNGHHPTRTLVSGVGPVEVTQPRMLDRRIVGQNQDGQDVDAAGRPITRFGSKILPPYLRTTKPIESIPMYIGTTVRLRHRRTKGNGSRAACLAMVFKLCESAGRKWRLLNGAKLLPHVIAGVQFIDGEEAEQNAA